jgi:hypothetical protein
MGPKNPPVHPGELAYGISDFLMDPSFVIAKVLIFVQSLALAPPCLISRGELDREGSKPVVGNSRAGDVCRLIGGKDSV